MAALNEKEKARLNELLNKALAKDSQTLNEAEIKELQTILLKLEKAQKEKEGKSSEEKLSEAMDKAMIKQALVFNEKKTFEKLPLKEKLKIANERLDKLTKIENSQAFKNIQKKNKEHEEKAALESYWREHEKRYGSKL